MNSLRFEGSKAYGAAAKGETLPENAQIQSAPSDANIYCNGSYGFSHENGFYTIQRACGTQTAQWGFRLSPYTQSIIVGYVRELGMDWKKNGIWKPRMAPHTVPSSYRFHGTYNPVRAGDSVYYNDVFAFRHNMGPGGEGTVTIYGSLSFRANG